MRHWLKALALLPLLAFAAPGRGGADGERVRRPNGRHRARGHRPGPRREALVHREGARSDKIGRVTPGNPALIEEFALPTDFTGPFDITVGPDHKIWSTASATVPAR